MDTIGVTNIIDYIRSASEPINSLFGLTFRLDNKNKVLVNGKLLNIIYLMNPWEV